ncbi:hypothetical protein [Desulfitobacterium metallireducens]|uniref:hypothetical protein n=1 Tax=Desulfitobacterium metallireducens TaxID=142877 RepID=UPI00023142F7|nr:hypothetical protein [Desulfitobacterium metallireducens]
MEVASKMKHSEKFPNESNNTSQYFIKTNYLGPSTGYHFKSSLLTDVVFLGYLYSYKILLSFDSATGFRLFISISLFYEKITGSLTVISFFTLSVVGPAWMYATVGSSVSTANAIT